MYCRQRKRATMAKRPAMCTYNTCRCGILADVRVRALSTTTNKRDLSHKLLTAFQFSYSSVFDLREGGCLTSLAYRELGKLISFCIGKLNMLVLP